MSEEPLLTKSVLVTGASGFVGRHLCAHLVAAGHEVHALVRESTKNPVFPDGIETHRVKDPVAAVGALVNELRPDGIAHLATLFAAKHSPTQISGMIEANVTFGTAVAEAAAGNGARLVHATSAWQHYSGAEYSPVSLYAATKQALVDILRYYAEVEGLPVGEVCLFDTYGRNDARGKLVSLLINHAESGAPLLMSSGRQLIDLTHVSDVARAFEIALAGAVDNSRLVVRSGTPLQVRDLARLIEEVTSRQLNIVWGARPDRAREMVQDWEVSGSSTAWTPQQDLKTGIADLWAERTQP